MKKSKIHNLQNRDVLVADDNPLDLKLLESILKKDGYSVRTLNDGKLVVDSVKSKLPSLILLDIKMPGRDGFDICRKLKEDELTKAIPVIFISALSNPIEKIKAFEFGGVDYITKPFKSKEMLARVAAHINLFAALQEIDEKNKLLENEIKEHKCTEKKLEVERDNLYNIFETMPDGMYISDRQNNILFANDNLVNEFGSYEGKKCYEYFRGSKEVCPWCTNEKVFAGKPSRGESSHIKEGKCYDVISTSITLPDGSIGKMEVLRDVTEKKLMEETLEISEGKFRTIFENAPVLIDAFDKNGKCILWNSESEKTFGWSIDEINSAESPLELFYPDPEIRDKVIKSTGKQHKKEFKEWHPYNKYGKQLVTLWANFEVSDGLVINLGYDITERKKASEKLRISEEKLRLVIDNIPQAVFWKDRNSVFQGCNQNLIDLLQMTGQEDIIGKTDYDFCITKNGADTYRETDRQVMESGVPQFHISELLHNPDGSMVWLDTNKIPLRDEMGNVNGVLITVEDITERKRLEEKQFAHIFFIEKMERVDEIIRKSSDFNQMLSDVLDVVLDIFDCDRAWLLFPCDPETETWSVPMERTKPEYPGVLASGEDAPTSPKIAAAFREVLDENDVVTIDYRDSSKVTELSKKFSMCSEMHMAVHPQTGKPWMFGIHQCSRYRDWTEDEQGLLKEIGRRLGDGLSVMLSFKELQAREEKERDFQGKLTELHSVSTTLSKCATEDELWKQAVILGREKLGFDRLGIWVSTGKPEEMRGTYGTDPNGNLLDERKYVTITDPESAMGRAIKSKSTCIYNENAEVWDYVNGEIRGHSPCAVAPLWDGENVIGGISTDNFIRNSPITENDQKLLVLYASLLGNLGTRMRKEETERKFQEKLAALHSVSTDLSHCMTEDDLWKKAIELGRKIFGFDRLGIWLTTDTPGVLRGTFGTDSKGNLIDERHLKSKTNPECTMSRALKLKTTCYYKESEGVLDGFNGKIIGHAARAVAPLWDGDIVIGGISMDNFLQHRPITENHRKLLVLFASFLGHLGTRMRKEETERDFQEKLAALHAVSVMLSQCSSEDELWKQAIVLGRGKLGFDRVGIWIKGGNPEEMHGTYGTDSKGNLVDEHHLKYKISHESKIPIDQAIETKTSIYFKENDDILDETLGNSIGHASRAIAPLWDGDIVIGAISTDNFLLKSPMTENDRKLLVLFASFLGHLGTRIRNDEKERTFLEKLTILHDTSIELSKCPTEDDLWKQAIVLGRSKLGFDRLGIWLKTDVKDELRATFGTDSNGNVIDVRHIRSIADPDCAISCALKLESSCYFTEKEDIWDENLTKIVGTAARAVAPLWDGDNVIGAISTDNYILKRPITENDRKLLILLASFLGHLGTRFRNEEKERTFLEKLTILHDTSIELSKSTTEDELWKQAIVFGRRKLGFDRLGIWLKTDTPGEIRSTFGTDLNGNLSDNRSLRGIIDPEFAMGAALSSEGSCCYKENDVVIDDLSGKTVGTAARAVAPLWDGDNVIGGISTDNYILKRPITENDRKLLNLFASFLGHLGTRMRNEEKEKDFLEKLTALHDVSVELSNCVSEDDLWKQAVKLACDKLGFDRLGIWLKTDVKGEMRGTFGTDLKGNLIDERNLTYMANENEDKSIEKVLENKKSSFHVEKSPIYDEKIENVVGYAARVVAPLWNGENIIGVVTTDNYINKKLITENDRELLQLFASLLGHLGIRQRNVEEVKSFQERLTELINVSTKLSRCASENDLWQQTIELGREKLGFDRLGIWLKTENSDLMTGTFGTDCDGNIIDEHHLSFRLKDSSESPMIQVINEKTPIYLKHNDNITDNNLENVVGCSDHAIAPLWNGDVIIGAISTDNFISKKTMTENDRELLLIYSSLLGHLVMRLRDEEKRLGIERKMLHAQKLESLGVLAGGIAHDFNNILMAVLGYSDLVLQELPHYSPMIDDVKEIKKAASRAAELSKQMLAYSGKGKFVIEPIELNLLVKEMSRMLDVSISKKVELKYDFTDDLPKFDGDATQIRQIIMNMITNASEAIGENNGVVSISTGSIICDNHYLETIDDAFYDGLDTPMKEGAYIYMKFSDTGCGMDKQTLGKLFDPFFTTKFTGRGLGMAAVLGIVKGHQGAIKIYSEVGKGTTFTVLFPIIDKIDQIENKNNGNDKMKEKWQGKGTILIADDEEFAAELRKRMIEMMGFNALCADDGQKAVELYKENIDDIVCVILDLNMPVLDGEQAFKEIRRIKPDVKIILSSGYAEKMATKNFKDLNLNDFIQKPYTFEKFSEKIREVIEE